MRRQQQGFTLIEVLVVVALLGILFTLSVGALRHYWQVETLNGARDSLLSQMRAVQERSVSESHPLVYGVRLSPAAAATTTSSRYAVIKYDPVSPTTTSDDTCTVVGVTHTFGGGVFTASAAFGAASSPVVVSKCPAASGDKFVLFYARGTATDGTLTLKSASLGETRAVEVTGLTGRVDAR